MNATRITLLGILALFSAGLSAECPAQQGAPPKPVNLNVGPEFLVRYPSLEPVTVIAVHMADPPEMYSLIEEAIGNNAQKPRWDCTQVSSYSVSVVSKDNNGTKVTRNVGIAAVVLEGNGGDNTRLTSCSLGSPPQIQLVLKSSPSANETIQVSLVGLPDGMTAQWVGTLKFTQTIHSFSAAPQAAPSEKLTNGKSRDTGQLNVSFSDSNLFSPLALPFNTYVKSKDLFSTDEKDSQSSFSGTIGIQRGIFPNWYAPLHFEETMQGNQTATNLSSLTTLGITTLLPWGGSARVFNNIMIRALLPPDVTINNQYTHRINQNVSPASKALATDDYSLNPVASWSSIQLPWMCNVFQSLKIMAKQEPNDHSKAGPLYCFGIEMDLGAYYLPLDLTPAKNQRYEGYGDVSILIPLTGLSFASKIFPYMSSGDPAKSQMRIKYSDSVNPANNYARSKQWTYGIELIK